MKKGFVRLATPEIQQDSIVDGEGIRSVIWFQGCSHNCFGCHNPETHDFNGGTERSIKELIKEISELEYQEGVTFSGGDPMMQVEALLELAKCVKENNMDVWVYTGYTFEQLMELSKSKPEYREVMDYIDVLVDGKFVMDLRSFEVQFRGSSNQRLIDVKKTLETGSVVKVEKYK